MIAKIKRKMKLYEILLFSLSESDFMFGISNIFINTFFLARVCNNQHLVTTAFTIYLFFVLTSMFHLSFITVDGLIVVLKPFQYKLILSRKRVYIFLVLLWILAVAKRASLQILDEFTDTFKRDALKPALQNQELLVTTFPNIERKENVTQRSAALQSLLESSR